MSQPSRKVIIRRRQVVAGGAAVLLGGAAVGVGAWLGRPAAGASEAGAAEAGATSTPEPPRPSATSTPEPVATFDLAANSIDDPTSPWVVVNKLRSLDPQDYEPDDLTYPDVPYVNRQPMRAATADALVQLFDAAQSEAGLTLRVQSAYRSYDTQVSVYAGWVSSRGQAGADATSARPGHSEHQTGWAVDVTGASGECALEICWGETAEGVWVGENAHRFGLIVRYRADTTPITGYESEPYHLRYVGPELAAYMQEQGITTLEQLFSLPDAPDYAPGTTD
ncbi:M15 family metallopeptidase [Microbacteriaceae bacterium VKM Ac-2854]|nr:M15 family metallopeptidase [Microbacteriaceae bacterium VKM Ac-2854]